MTTSTCGRSAAAAARSTRCRWGRGTNARQTRVDPRDIAPPGYTVTSFSAGFTRFVPRGALTVDLSLRNAFDVRYRSFMSRYKEFALSPGRALVLRVTTAL